MSILWLGQPECHDRSLVGGKVANLSRLAGTYLVPPGFCLSTRAYDLALVGGAASEGQNEQTLRLPPELVAPLAAAYHELAERSGEAEPRVAVRSSAVDEDGVTASFAGQYETFLNVTGVDGVLGAIVRCWASARSGRAAHYRRQHGLPADGGRLAVLVQLLVMADVSAVAFGAHPVTGDRGEIVITANWGLGESIVGGTATPDTFTVRRDDLTIVSRQICEKRRMTVVAPGGTREATSHASSPPSRRSRTLRWSRLLVWPGTSKRPWVGPPTSSAPFREACCTYCSAGRSRTCMAVPIELEPLSLLLEPRDAANP